MRLDLSQQMKMDQRMILAPRMIQSMEILQLPMMALQERIEQELLSNPTLEMEEPAFEEEGGGAREETVVDDRTDAEKTLHLSDDNNKSEDFARLDNQDYDYHDYMNRGDYIRRTSDKGEPDRKLEAMQNTAAPDKTLNEHLHGQWMLVECDPQIRIIGKAIIDLINDDGYLPVELEKVQDQLQTKATPEQQEEALALVQTMDPTGVGARDLTECMLLQLAESDEDLDLERELVQRHLKDIEANRFPLIAKRTGHSIEEIQQAVRGIARLDPRPGLQFSPRNISYVVPDIIIECDEETGVYSARLADETTPTLRINSSYAEMARSKSLDAQTRDFLKNNIQSARWLIESIQQRKQTLMNVVNYALRSQYHFFDKGPQGLRPLPMVEVADALKIHVTTVSRAVSGKYMQTPTGIFPLKYFFRSGTETAAGDSVSWDSIRAQLQVIINNEDKKNPYNDDELVEELKKHGLEVARRTVAKYRGIMKVPTARQRKQHI